jgi:Helix-hairpin-helix domain
MIVASLLLVIAAAVTLLLGLLDREAIQWVWASIACCLLAGLLLTIGVLRARPSRKPVLQSGGEGAAASWAGASGWGGNTGESSGSVLTRDDDEAADSTVNIADGPELQGDDEPTRTDMPAPPTDTEDAAESPWAPTAPEHDETGEVSDVRVVPPAAEPVAAEPSPAAPEDDVIVVPKPSARGGMSAEQAGAGQPAAVAGDQPPVARGSIKAPREATSDDAARFEQVLSPIAGVGAAKRAALFQHFGTYRKLRAATPEKLAQVPGISRTLADRIHAALHGK